MARPRTRGAGPETGVVVSEVEERRAMLEPIEFRESEDSATVSGYAAVFNKDTVIGGGGWGFRERIAPGAFDEAITRDDVRALFNHDPNILLGRNVSGTLRLSVDKRGLKYEIDMPDTQAANDVRTLIKRGDVSGSSFAFRVEEDGEEWDEEPMKKGQLPVRTITRAELFDVSPVTYPAYPQTSVSARSKAQAAVEATARAQAAIDAAKTPDVTAREAARAAVEQAKAWPTP